MNDPFSSIVAARTMDLLRQKRALLHSTGTVFWIRPLRDRIVVVFDPGEVVINRVNDDFAHELSTLLHGRRVVRTNTCGLYLQIGYVIPPHVELTTQPLDLAAQPTPWSLPIGMTAQGPLWIGMMDGDSYLVGGVRGMGKSGLLHGMIQALQHGNQTLVYAWDGKDNAEYLRYWGKSNFHLLPMDGLQDGLQEIGEQVSQRMRQLTRSGHANIITYNAANPDKPIPPIALVIDEVAEVADQSTLLRLVKVYRAAGVHPIFATNDPSKASVVAKSNLGTRISLPVVSHADSFTILGHTGANKLPRTRGRGLIVNGGRLVEFQAFDVQYPQPSVEALAWLAGQQPKETPEDIERRRVQELIGEGKSDTAIVRAVWNVYSGGRFYSLIDKVKSIRECTSTPEVSVSSPKMAEVTA